MTNILNTDNIDTTETEQPSKTYKINLNSGRLAGLIDDKEAIHQAVKKILLTERFSFIIYSWNYGSELEFYMGKSMDYVKGDIERSITEALTQDSRVLSITDFTYSEPAKDTLNVSFTVNTIAGSFTEKTEVKI